jgi:hypothetical protein
MATSNKTTVTGRGPAALANDGHDVMVAMIDRQYSLSSTSQRTKTEKNAFRKRRQYHTEVVHNPFSGRKEKRLFHTMTGKFALNSILQSEKHSWKSRGKEQRSFSTALEAIWLAYVVKTAYNANLTPFRRKNSIDPSSRIAHCSNLLVLPV